MMAAPYVGYFEAYIDVVLGNNEIKRMTDKSTKNIRIIYRILRHFENLYAASGFRIP